MARPKYPSDDLAQFMLRMPPDMRDRIKKVAEENNRSMNAEIVATLEEVYPAGISFSEFVEALIEASTLPTESERLSRIEYLNKRANDTGLLVYGRLKDKDGIMEVELVLKERDRDQPLVAKIGLPDNKE